MHWRNKVLTAVLECVLSIRQRPRLSVDAFVHTHCCRVFVHYHHHHNTTAPPQERRRRRSLTKTSIPQNPQPNAQHHHNPIPARMKIILSCIYGPRSTPSWCLHASSLTIAMHEIVRAFEYSEPIEPPFFHNRLCTWDAMDV
jgi:hypothetical protein